MTRKSLTAVSQKEPLLLLGSQMTTGGAQGVLLNLAGWLHHHGYPVTAAFFYDKDGLHQCWQQGVPFPIHDLRGWQAGGGLQGLLRLPGGLWRLWRLMRRSRCRAVLTFTHHSNLLGVPLAWLAGAPLRFASHRGKIHGFRRWQERLHAWMINSGMATRLVAVSEGVRREAVAEGVHPNRITVIPNGVAAPPASGVRDSTLRAELGVSRRSPLVLSVGRLAPEKGHDLLLTAMPEVLAAVPEVHLALAGDGGTRLALQEQAQKLGIAGRVHFLGNRSDVPQLLAAADLFVLPSRSEGLPNALMEAQVCGMAAVAFDVGGVGEIVVDGETGVLAPPQDVTALAKAMVALLKNKNERKRMGEAGRRRALRLFSLDAMCQKYATLLCGQELEQR